MSLPIEHQLLSFSSGDKTKRRRNPKAQLITVNAGVIVIHIGQQQLTLSEAESLWLPHECLFSICCITPAELTVLHFSIRVTLDLPSCACKIADSVLFSALITEVSTLPIGEWQGQYGRLLLVILDQLQKLVSIEI